MNIYEYVIFTDIYSLKTQALTDFLHQSGGSPENMHSATATSGLTFSLVMFWWHSRAVVIYWEISTDLFHTDKLFS